VDRPRLRVRRPVRAHAHPVRAGAGAARAPGGAPGDVSPRARPGRAVLLAGAVLVAVVAILAASGDRDGAPAPLVPPRVEVDEDFDVAGFEPIGFGTTDEEELLDRGRRGYEHVLYEKSPGGVEATAARVHRFAGLIEAAAERHGVSAETLGALVFLESAGRPEVMAGDDPRNAT